ncbi:uncharacterized protein LOC144656685 [Oculina patagonica]
MIDPRNMPCARVCLPRLSAGELPPNAQEQYHSYVVKRKSSRTSLNAGKDTTEIGVSSPSPMNFSFTSGVSDQAFTCSNSLKVARDTSWAEMSEQCVPGNNTNGTCTSTQISPPSYSWPPIMKDCLDTKPDDTTVNTWSTKRRNSVVSTSSRCSSGSSKGRELVASVCLTPVTLKTPGYTPRPYEHCMSETELECSEALSDVTDDSTLSGAESAKNFSHFVRKKLQSQDFSYEKLSVTSSLSTAVASEQDMDQSTYSSSFASFSDHIMYGCEDMWPDLQSYSPPESPVPQKTEIIVSEDFSKETSGIEDPNARIQPANSEVRSGFLYPTSSDMSCFSVEQNGCLYPEIKLVPLEVNNFSSHNEKRTFPPSESACKRRSLSGNLLVKIEDVGEKLKPCASGGLTVVANSAKERYTSSGRRIANSYSEKSLAKLSMTRALAQVKKRKVRSKVGKGPSLGGDTGLVSDLEQLSGKQGKKRKRLNKNPAGRKKNILSRYENLKFSELNTVPRMSVRYKVAFTKWPYVFSGALDLINQRLTSQNAFWDSLRS